MMHYDYVCLSTGCAHLNVSLPLIKQTVQRFVDGEIEVAFSPIVDSSILFLTSMAGEGRSANDHLVETLVTLRALRRAKHVTLGIVYGAYTRQADGGQWMYGLLGDADDVWILDPHVPPPAYIKVRTAVLMFADDIRSRFENPVIVSPDKGGANRAAVVADYLNSDLCILSKSRGGCVRVEGCESVSVAGRICVIVDDIIDSGQTLMAANTYLMGQGAKEIHAYATHGLMSQQTAVTLTAMFASLCVSDSVVQDGLPAGWTVLSSGQSQLGV